MSGTILIVDPVATNRITMKVRLAQACYSTAMAATVEDAVSAARLARPDLIVADESLLAAGLCLRLAEAGRGIPVIALCNSEGRLAALRAGADAVLERAADEFMLMARIRSLMTGKVAAGLQPEPAGMAEAQAAWGPAPVEAGRLVLIAQDAATTIGWRQALATRGAFAIEANTPERALIDAAGGRPADIYLIAADLRLPGDGLRLLSELRARPASRDCAFVIAMADERKALAPIALDLGADDVLPVALRDRAAADEAALRLTAQLSRKRAADRSRAAAERERRWALTDPLTGLHNRRYALPRLEEMASGSGDLAVMVIDLDRFKAINDSYGHAAGDAVLAEVAARLAAAVPPSALLSRLGGEEFLVAVPGLTPWQADAMAERLRSAIAQAPVAMPALLGGGAVAVTASVGLAQANPGEGAELLMLRADRALLRAKQRGRNMVISAAHEAAA